MVSSIGSLTKYNIYCVDIDSSLFDAYKLMQQKKIRHLPVKDGEQIIAILSDRDVQRGMRVEIFDLDGRELIDIEVPHDLKVRQFMSWPLKTVEASHSIKEVTRKMIREKVSAFLVLEHTHVAGIVTHEDLLIYLDSLLKDEKHFSLPLVGALVQSLANSGI